MRALLIKLVTILVSLGASVRLVLSFKDPTTSISIWQAAGILLIVALTAILLFTEIQDYRKSRIKVLKSETQIRDFMYDLVSNGNRVCIFTRDMSWAHDKNMKDMLTNKARAGDLTLVMPGPTELSTMLQKESATVHYYGTATPPTKTRFTITNVDRAEVRITIGRNEGTKRHTIETFAEQHGHPAYSLAQDLASLLRAINPSTSVRPDDSRSLRIDHNGSTQ